MHLQQAGIRGVKSIDPVVYAAAAAAVCVDCRNKCIMATLVYHICKINGRSRTLLRLPRFANPFVLPFRSYSQGVWDELLGRKVEPSLAEKLEEAFTDYRVLKSAPILHKLGPISSYWTPSEEVTMKQLERIMQMNKVDTPMEDKQAQAFAAVSSKAPTITDMMMSNESELESDNEEEEDDILLAIVEADSGDDDEGYSDNDEH